METVRKEAKGTQYQDLRVEHHLKGINNGDETVVFRRPSVAWGKLTGESVGLTGALGVGRWQESKNEQVSSFRPLKPVTSLVAQQQSNKDG